MTEIHHRDLVQRIQAHPLTAPIPTHVTGSEIHPAPSLAPSPGSPSPQTGALSVGGARIPQPSECFPNAMEAFRRAARQVARPAGSTALYAEMGPPAPRIPHPPSVASIPTGSLRSASQTVQKEHQRRLRSLGNSPLNPPTTTTALSPTPATPTTSSFPHRLKRKLQQMAQTHFSQPSLLIPSTTPGPINRLSQATLQELTHDMTETVLHCISQGMRLEPAELEQSPALRNMLEPYVQWMEHAPHWMQFASLLLAKKAHRMVLGERAPVQPRAITLEEEEEEKGPRLLPAPANWMSSTPALDASPLTTSPPTMGNTPPAPEDFPMMLTDDDHQDPQAPLYPMPSPPPKVKKEVVEEEASRSSVTVRDENHVTATTRMVVVKSIPKENRSKSTTKTKEKETDATAVEEPPAKKPRTKEPTQPKEPKAKKTPTVVPKRVLDATFYPIKPPPPAKKKAAAKAAAPKAPPSQRSSKKAPPPVPTTPVPSSVSLLEDTRVQGPSPSD